MYTFLPFSSPLLTSVSCSAARARPVSCSRARHSANCSAAAALSISPAGCPTIRPSCCQLISQKTQNIPSSQRVCPFTHHPHGDGRFSLTSVSHSICRRARATALRSTSNWLCCVASSAAEVRKATRSCEEGTDSLIKTVLDGSIISLPLKR
jgi:hypothetical protein